MTNKHIEKEFDNLLWKVIFAKLTPETQEFIKIRFTDASSKIGEQKRIAYQQGYREAVEVVEKILDDNDDGMWAGREYLEFVLKVLNKEE